MKILKNQGAERVVDELRHSLSDGGTLDVATPGLSLFAYGELREVMLPISQMHGQLDLSERTFRTKVGGLFEVVPILEPRRAEAKVESVCLLESVVVVILRFDSPSAPTFTMEFREIQSFFPLLSRRGALCAGMDSPYGESAAMWNERILSFLPYCPSAERAKDGHTIS